ncbi:hypothetical protein Tco_0562877, partial [Tanacetum coccineum]
YLCQQKREHDQQKHNQQECYLNCQHEHYQQECYLNNDPSEDMEEREEEAVPLRRKRSVYRRARTEFNTLAFAQFHAPLSADVLSQAAISESAGPSVG